jgi:peptidoglycan/LPS O-acetylase OafA/YrhL
VQGYVGSIDKLVTHPSENLAGASRKPARLREIDGLRFFAIAAVLAVHYRPPSNPLFQWMSVGWAGVDLFFVISGFLITGILLNLRGSPHPFRKFYWRRTLRIFPPYYLVLFPLLVLSVMDDRRFVFDSRYLALIFLSSIKKNPFSLAFHRIFGLHVFNCGPLPIDHHIFSRYMDGINIFWSLSVEELFYLCWAPIVLKCGRRTVLACVTAALLLCPFARALAFNCFYLEDFVFFFRLDSLMAGSGLALLFAALRKGTIRERTVRRCLTGILVAALIPLAVVSLHAGLLRGMEVRSFESFSVLGYTLNALVCCSVLGMCVLNSGGSQWWCRLLRWRPLVYIGTISYMLYLIHIPVFVTLYRLLEPTAHGRAPSVLLTGALAATLSVALASLSWRYFESPILALKDRLFTTAPPVK